MIEANVRRVVPERDEGPYLGRFFPGRAAPPVESNPGGGIEVVVPPDATILESFSTKKPKKKPTDVD